MDGRQVPLWTIREKILIFVLTGGPEQDIEYRESFIGHAASAEEEKPVAGRKSRTLTEVELEFMQVVWPAGGVTPQQVQNILKGQGRPLSDGSVRKILAILVRKGYLKRKREGRAFLYKPVVPPDRANRSMVLDLLKRAFGGSAALMVATLLDAEAVTQKDVEQIKKLIAEREKGAGR